MMSLYSSPIKTGSSVYIWNTSRTSDCTLAGPKNSNVASPRSADCTARLPTDRASWAGNATFLGSVRLTNSFKLFAPSPSGSAEGGAAGESVEPK